MKMNANIVLVMYLHIVQTQWAATIVHVSLDMMAMDCLVMVRLQFSILKIICFTY